MALKLISRVLLRAPLLPVSALGRGAAAVFRDPAAAAALAWSAPALAGSRKPGAERALENYARRAAYRPTPHGLWAGVAVATLGARTRLATGRSPGAYRTVAWSRLAALGRALLDEPAARAAARLRIAPSLLRGEREVRWLAFGAPGSTEAVSGEAEVDDALACVLDAATAWRPFAEVREALAAVEPADPDALDDYLLRLVDDGLLVHDLEPPLVGPPPLVWMLDRLAQSPALAGPRAALTDVAAALTGPRAALTDDTTALTGTRTALTGAAAALTDDTAALTDVAAALTDDTAALTDDTAALTDDTAALTDVAAALTGPRAGVASRVAARRAALAPATRKRERAISAAQTRAITVGAREIEAARARLAELPGASDAEPLHAVLVHEAGAAPTLSRAAVERAAALAPLLFRVQEVLAPPAAERALDPGIDQAIDAVTEVFGAGALDLGALARGDYGTPLDADELRLDRGPAPRAAHAPLVALLTDRLLAAAAAGDEELRLTSEELDAVVPAAPSPPSFELVLTPAREPRGARPGTGWLVGLHAPAGATWGRFAAPLGAPLAEALDELAATERAARPDETRLDVAFAPARALGDLAAHPPTRRAALALSSWPAGAAVTPAELALCADPGAREPLALRVGRVPVVPSPLERLRSTTAPPGAYRLLAGWSLYRQHAPWALSLGPLGGLAWLPRISVDGLVVAPASWRQPELGSPAALRRWRRAAGVPRWVQVGHEDELLPVDLDGRGALVELARDPDARLFEIWPPLDAIADAGGRRVEAVVAVVDVSDPREAAHAAAAVAACGLVPPPALAPPAAGFRTFKLFGAAGRADRVLAGAVGPAVEGALAAGEIDRWFFLRYVDAPGRRDHLRVRVRETRAGRFAARLDDALAPARAAGDVVAIETAEYRRELARYGADAIDAVERIFESDSALACALAGGLDDDGELVELVVRDFDALAAGLGLSLAERHAAAARRRAAYFAGDDARGRAGRGDDRARDDGGRGGGGGAAGVVDEELERARSAEFRRLQPRLHAALAEPGPRFVEHRERVARAAAELPRDRREALLAPLVHLAAVRLAGNDRTVEAAAVYLWERALDGLVKRAAKRGTIRP